MTINQAIKILSQTEGPTTYQFNPDLKDALKLGIEALKRIQNCRVQDAASVELALPGETED